MFPTTSRPSSVRPAAVVNEDIRTLVRACGGWLYGETRAEYERLVEEWAAAVRAEMAPAA